MNELLRVAETLPGATPFSPSNDSSLLSSDPSAPLSQQGPWWGLGVEGRGGQCSQASWPGLS